MGQVLTCVIIVFIPAVIAAGPFFNPFLHKVYPSMCHKNIDVSVLGDFREFGEKDTPGFRMIKEHLGLSLKEAFMSWIFR